MKCYVPYCTSNNHGIFSHQSYHIIPKRNAIVRDKWLRAIRRQNEQNYLNQRVCSDHFLKSDYYVAGKSRLLKKGVIPSVFSWPAEMWVEGEIVTSEIFDMYYCAQCSHQSAWVFQLDRHIRRSHKIVNAAELFNATGEPEQLFCIKCDYKTYHQFALYEHYKQCPNDAGRSFGQESKTYPSCGYCRYESDSCLPLAKHISLCKKFAARFRCNHCSYRCKEKANLKRHKLQHVTNENIN